MTRKPDSGNSTPAKTLAAIKSMRGQIDKLDLQILKLINERASLAAEIGKLAQELHSIDTTGPIGHGGALWHIHRISHVPQHKTFSI